MNDLEWYLNLNGKQSGPHSAKEIVELVRANKIPGHAQVTTARMSGDWVTANDLLDAYQELFTKKPIATPITPFEGDSTQILHDSSNDPDFTAPPRPTEQLEATKTIYLNRNPQDRAPDPTDALFLAIQAVREKAQLKTVSMPSAAALAREATLANSNDKVRSSSSAVLIVVLAALFGGTVYGITLFLKNKSPAAATAKTPAIVEREKSPERINPAPARGANGLLNDSGVQSPSARIQRPSQAMQPSARTAPSMPANLGNARNNRLHPSERLEPGGGARYRDERDPPTSQDRFGGEANESPEEPDVDEGEYSAQGQDIAPAPVPLDPSQVQPGGFNQDPYNAPQGGLAPYDGASQQ